MSEGSAEWEDWRWHLRNRVRTATDFGSYLELSSEEERAIELSTTRFHVGATPYYLSLLNPDDLSCPIRKQVVPSLEEFEVGALEQPDPLAEERDSPVPGVTHRYANRVLLYASHDCPVYCRHCTRRRKVSDPSSAMAQKQLEDGVKYIRSDNQICDVVISGGDPLSLGDDVLDGLLTSLQAIEHVDFVRIGTRFPTTLPQRITPALCTMLKRHAPVYVMTHFNHPVECTTRAQNACAALADAGCVLSNQTVLLRGVNDDLPILMDLSRHLLRMRVRPYRLYHCDYSEGTGHFRVPISRGVELIDGLRGDASGLGVPEYMVDLPDGLGKVPVDGHSARRRTDGMWVLRSYRGEWVVLPNA